MKKTRRKPSLTFCGVGRDRTADTRIFSPLLYRLSYRTILISRLSFKFILRQAQDDITLEFGAAKIGLSAIYLLISRENILLREKSS
jgi:hypothetical protein